MILTLKKRKYPRGDLIESAGPEVIPKKKVKKLISDQKIEEEDAQNLVDEVNLQNRKIKDLSPRAR
jgi:hypothetical protein